MKRLLLLLAMLLSFLGLRAASEPLEIGAAVPAVAAVDDAGQPFDLVAYCVSGYALVYFYPLAVRSAYASRKLHPCAVQPGVSALG
jgi:hypothetical protein